LGGDYLFRWGNPQSYDRGSNSDHLLFGQHGVNWIPEGSPGEGNLILFNNNYSDHNIAAVFELIPPLNDDGVYDLIPGQPFGPIEPIWIHAGYFYTLMQGGAFRLPNGNTLITDCDDALMIEVTSDHQVVWSHEFLGGGQSFIARAQKFPLNYLGSFPEFIIGDINLDGNLDIFDLLYMSDMVYGFGYSPTPPADFNGDGSVTISDIILFVQAVLNN
jgi:hypothetical protein